MKPKKIFSALLLSLALVLPVKAEVITIEPLFEYPVSPEEIVTLSDKSNWLMQHFWDNMDFKKKGAVNQSALNDAFKVYSLPMQWAEKAEVDKSVASLLDKIQKNPTLLLQFTKAAESSLYSERADIWIDEVYLKFLDAFLKNKKIPEIRKRRYERQMRQISNSLNGSIAPSFDFTTPTGTPGKFQPIGVFTIIEFGDPDCDDCRHAKLRMETDVRFSSLVERGLVNVLFILPDPVDGWQTKMTDYPANWVTGASDTVSDILDLRLTPSFYVIGKDGKIMEKNVSVDQAMKIAFKETSSDK